MTWSTPRDANACCMKNTDKGLNGNELGVFILGAACVVGIWGLLTLLFVVQEVASDPD